MVYSRRPASFFSYLPNQHLENSIAMTLCTCLQRFGTVWARFSIFQSSSILFLSARADAALSKTGPTDNSATTGANFFGCTHKLRPPRPTRLISALSPVTCPVTHRLHNPMMATKIPLLQTRRQNQR